jgi:hypothetical protein
MLDGPEVKVRVAEAAAALLGLECDPPEWTASDYEAAMNSKFQAPAKTDFEVRGNRDGMTSAQTR